MKKFLLILLLGCVGMLPFRSFADITIGTGTADQNIPIYPYYGYTYSQTIYYASQINGSGNITTLQFYFSGTSLAYSNDWTIYMGHTTKTGFTSTTDWIPVASMTQVYSAIFTSPTASGWITFDITDFAYNGTDNLVIAVDENKASYEATSANYFYSTATSSSTDYRAILYYSDSNNPNPASPPTASGRRAYQPNVILGGITPTLPTLTVDKTSLAFGYVPSGGTSTEQSYVLAGTNLTAGPIVVTAPTGFEVSLTSGSGFASSINVTYTPPTLGNTTIWARFKPTSPSTLYSGNITHVGGGASVNVAVSGSSYEHMKWCATSQATSTADEDIFNVTVGTINNSSTCATLAPGYGSILNRYSNYYYDVAPAGLNRGATVPFSVQVGTCGTGTYANAVAIYVDLNGDGTFDPTGERLYLSSATTAGAHIETGNLVIPMGSTLGYTMMRVVNVETTTPSSITPCGSYSWGETEDYKVEILPVIAGSLNGYVYDQEGSCTTPLVGATVTIAGIGLSQITDGTGYYNFPTVPIGTYSVTASLDGWLPQTQTGVVVTENNATVQDFCLYPDLMKPAGLQAYTTGPSLTDVHVQWAAPGTLPPEQWITWDNGTYTGNAVGYNGPATFSVASLWPVADIAPYSGLYLKKIKFWPYEPSSVCTYTIKVWTGSTPPTEIYSYTIPGASIVAGTVNEVTLPTGVPISGAVDFWFGYECATTAGYPAGVDIGPAVAGKGDMLYDQNTTWVAMSGFGLNYNWVLQGWLSQSSLAPDLLTPLVEGTAPAPIENVAGATLMTSKGEKSTGPSFADKRQFDKNTVFQGLQSPQSPKMPSTTLLGYNLYRTPVVFTPTDPVFTTNLYYDDLALPKGQYCYEVAALYSYGESEKIGPVCVNVFTCHPPLNLQVPIATTTTTTAVVSWDPSTITPNPEWIYEYGPAGYVQGSGIVPPTYIDQDFVNLASLTPGMEYDFYVRTFCTVGDSSTWIKKTFRTHFWDNCPAGSTAEVEVCGDTTNNGCNNIIPAFEPLACGETKCGTSWFNGSTRDTDWYEFTLAQETEVTWSGAAEYTLILGFIAAPCPATAFITYNIGDPGDTVTVSTILPAGTYYAFVATPFVELVACDSLDMYFATLTCNTDIYPPEITNIVYTPAGCTATDHLVTADITDDISIGTVKIVYTIDGIPQTDIPMVAGTPPQYSATIPAAGSGVVAFVIEATDNAVPVNTGTSPTITYQDEYLASTNLNAGPDQVIPVGNTATLDASYLTTSNCLRITEFTLYSTGTGYTNPYPAFMTSGTFDDIVEITNTGNTPVDIGGIHLKCEGSRATDYTFPSATVPAGGVVIVTFGTAADDIPNLYFTTDQTYDVWSSGTNQGIWLTQADGTTVIDAVATNAHTFSVASGVTATDWSGAGVSSPGGYAGAGLHGADANANTNWSDASIVPQNIGTVNSGLPLDCVASTMTLTWSGGNLPAPVVGNPIVTPVFNTPGTYTFTATLSDGTCTISDDVNVEVPVPVTPVADFTVNNTTQTTGGIVSTAVFTDLSTNYPSTWAWVITGPGAVNFVDATTSASQNPHVQFGAPGLYTVELTASNLAGFDTETKTDYILVVLGYCQSQASNPADEEIFSVTVNGATNAYDCFTVAPGPGSILNRYSNFTTLGSLTSMDQGATIGFTVEEDECDGATYYYNGCAIWIDWNQDGIFTEPDEVVYKETFTSQSPRTIAGNFVVPGTALTGETRMRVTVAEGYSGAGLTPCLLYSYGETEDYVVTITAPTYKTLNLTMFLEGLYTGAGTMHEALNDLFEPQWGAGVADQISIELHNDADYTVVEMPAVTADLSTAGVAVLNTIPASLNGSYYITVMNRNHILTVSAIPVDFSGGTISYDFSSAASQAYMDNQKDMLDGYFAIWGGDVNQDWLVDSGDMNPVDNDATYVIFVGYSPSDVNGDGLADSGDMNIVDNNATAIIMAWTP